MTVQELLKVLEGTNPNAQVRLAFQPHWPLEYSIGRVEHVEHNLEIIRGRPWSDEEDTYWWIFDPEDEDAEPIGPFPTSEIAEGHLEQFLSDNEAVVYIAEDDQLGYLPGHVSRALGWR